MTVEIKAAELADWIRRRRIGPGRILVGICGPPGSGKSTTASRLAVELDAPVVAMDGFHLPNTVLDERGIRTVKGAPQTFDAHAFIEAVRSIRTSDETVSLPTFNREIDEPEPDAVRISRMAPIVLVEGNYLLLDREPWSLLPPLLDAVVYLDIDDVLRTERLVARHVAFGKSRAEAIEFVRESDERNAALVAASRARADVIVREE